VNDVTASSHPARGPQAVTKFLKPRSVAIIGMSARAGSPGQVILQGLKVNGFTGDIHLVGRNPEPIDGRVLLKSADELPEGVDLAVFTLPAVGVPDAVEACVRRGVGSAMIFAAGFAETGDRETQERITRTARDGGLAIVGPNCLGYTNNVDGMMLHMLFTRQVPKFGPGSRPGLAVVGQSGGMLGHFQRAIDALKLPLAYVISTGNEAGLELVDFVEYLAADPATAVLALYAEEIKRPQAFLAACRRAQAAGKPVILLHPGRSTKAKQAAQSHTGSLIGDYNLMRTQIEQSGALVVNTMDEMMDLMEILLRYPTPSSKGPGILTASGAFVGVTNDFAEDIGLEIPELEPATIARFNEILPAFGTYGNPLDVTAGAAKESLPIAAKALVDDPNVGMLFISYPINNGLQVSGFNSALEGSRLPAVMVVLGDSMIHGKDVMDALAAGPFVFLRSSDRALRAIAQYTRYGKLLARPASLPVEPFGALPALGDGPQPEWLGKQVLAAAGIQVPPGALARTAGEAAAVAARIGYPVALKAQAALLAHKTEAGGVVLNLDEEAALRAAWDSMMARVKHAAPDVVLDGALVEAMSKKGVELMVGAKRDPAWGAVLLVGLGGIWVEALGDVKVLPVDATEAEVLAALRGLRSAKLLEGFRGAPAVDVRAVARIVTAIGRLMRTMPEIVEIDVNPLMVHPAGQGATALDALVVVDER
jgi:acyl-CoA synthetase (NDP forming)